MDRSNAAVTAATLTSILKQLPGNTAVRQRQRLLFALSQHGSVTTVDARRFLDIVNPCARICELRRLGYSISTIPTACATECGVVHRVGRYVLMIASNQHHMWREKNANWTQLVFTFGTAN